MQAGRGGLPQRMVVVYICDTRTAIGWGSEARTLEPRVKVPDELQQNKTSTAFGKHMELPATTTTAGH
jgi:hypothetical protein